MRWQWRRALLCALLLAVFLRPFAQRAAADYRQRHPGEPQGNAAAAPALRTAVAAGAPAEPALDPVALAAAQAAADAAAAEQQASSQRQQDLATAAAAEARGPPHWPPDKNNWWEDGLGLAPRSNLKRSHARIDILIVVLSGRAAKYSSRRETIRTTWAAGVIARATKQKLNLKLVFAVADNFCGYDPTSLAASVKSFPAARCQTVNEHNAGGTLSDEHTTLLAEYRKHKDLVFVPQTVDAYYTSATKMRTFYKCMAEAKINFGILIKLDDDGVILRKPFFEHYDQLKELMDPGVGGAAIGPRWWGNFNEWWAPVRAKDEAVEVAARFTRTEHNWYITEAEWPYHWFPTFAIGTGHALNFAAVECFGRMTAPKRTAKHDGSDAGGNRLDGGTSVWMEDVAHGVWFDVCAAEAEQKAKASGGVVTETARLRACRLFDYRWVKGPQADACRPDAHAIGSVGSRSAQQHTAKLGRTGKCPCTAEGGTACSETTEDVSKFHSQLLHASGGGKTAVRGGWGWPFLRCGTSAQVMMEADLFRLNASVSANDDERWPLTALTKPEVAAGRGGKGGKQLAEARLCTKERECVAVPKVFDPAHAK